VPSAAPDAADVQRFTAALQRLTGRDAPGRLGVAVSGGPDSMALLLLADAAFPGMAEAATVDHGLRADGAAEAETVGRWCADHGLRHATLRPERPITGNLQSAARTARYALLEEWRVARGLDWLLTAHHADDQLETMLMRLNRGSGVGGMAGVRGRSGVVLRPLLDWRKAELAALADGAGMPVAIDPSNADPRFDRAAMRARLGDVDWLDPVAATRSAAALAEAEEALDWLSDRIAAGHLAASGAGWVLTDTDYPREVQRRLVLRMVALADPAASTPRGDTLDHVVATLRAGGQASLGDWLLRGGARWTIAPAPPRRMVGDRAGGEAEGTDGAQ
jgi:tRNA(Ile)-lysidine synthase